MLKIAMAEWANVVFCTWAVPRRLEVFVRRLSCLESFARVVLKKANLLLAVS